MLVDFIEVENVFDNPDEIVAIAKQQTFVKKEAHYHGANSYYNGVRSPELTDIVGEERFHKITNELISKAMEKRLVNNLHRTNFMFGYTLNAYFHIMREEDIFDSNWIHQDNEAILAGLVYLNPNPRPNTGTLVYKDGKETIVENQYNKMIMYDTNYLHAPQGGFGTDVNDCRLSLVFFITEFKMKVNVEKNGCQTI